jgi:hypothetical protein
MACLRTADAFCNRRYILDVLRLMWRERKRESRYVSLLFAVYPFFMLQPFAVGSTHHWFGFLAFNTSLILMVLSIQATGQKMAIYPPRLRWKRRTFSPANILQVRADPPRYLWILISGMNLAFQKNNAGLPQLAALPGRAGNVFLLAHLRLRKPASHDRNEPVILKQLFSEPFRRSCFAHRIRYRYGLGADHRLAKRPTPATAYAFIAVCAIQNRRVRGWFYACIFYLKKLPHESEEGAG